MTRTFHCLDDLRRAARRRMPGITFALVDGAAGSEISNHLNCDRLEHVRLMPRVLVDISDRTLGKPFLGQNWGLPFGIAPMGMCNLAWPGTDKALAAAAVHYGMPVCLSTFGSSTIEDTRERAGDNAWFQLYVGPSVEGALELVARAEKAGYQYLVLTVDVPVVSARIRERRHGLEVPFRMQPRNFVDFALHPTWVFQTLIEGVPKPANVVLPDAGKSKTTFTRNEIRGHIDWDFLDRLRELWQGKLILKGVMSPADAVRIRDAGADAVYVSNHGGRQLDAAPPAIDMLPQIRAAVGSDYPLIFDSGVRSGEGIVKALALGADFVLLGRAFLYAAGAAGERGVFRLVDLLSEQVALTLGQIGYPDVGTIDRNALAVTQAGDLTDLGSV